jgi:hypothetical protein
MACVRASNPSKTRPASPSPLAIAIAYGLVRLAVSSVFLLHQFSTSQQPPASQQYFSLTRNQHQPPATSQPNEVVLLVVTGDEADSSESL